MVSVIVLICSMSQVPDHSACDRGNALESLPVEQEADEDSCLATGMFYLAAHFTIGMATEYPKVICRPPLQDLSRQAG